MFNRKKEKKPGKFSDINKEATLRGAVESTVRSSKAGAHMIRDGASILKDQTQSILFNTRMEGFQEAMERLGIKDEGLPLIHNQLIAQLYFIFFVSIASVAVSINYFVRGNYMIGALCVLMFFACITQSGQSSLRAFQIRRKELGLLGDWLASPGEWLPSRMTNLRKLGENDLSCHPLVREQFVTQASRNYVYASILFALSVATWLIGSRLGLMSGWMLVMASGVVFLYRGLNGAMEAYRRKIGVEVDFLGFISHVSEWKPSHSDVKISSKAQGAKAAGQ